MDFLGKICKEFGSDLWNCRQKLYLLPFPIAPQDNTFPAWFESMD